MRKEQINDEKIQNLIEENEKMKRRFSELEKKLSKKEIFQTQEFREILESISSFNARKDWIDKIIEKIKKILPI